MANGLSAADERLKQLKSDFLDDYKAEEKWREERKRYGRYYDGDQLTSEEIQELERRGQPKVVINRIKPKVDAILGIIQELRVDTKAYPAGTREEEAQFISEAFREIERASQFDEQEVECFKDLLIDGRGWYETYKVWDGLKARTVTEHVPNCFVCIDKYSRRADLKDCKRQHKHKWIDVDDAKGMFPGAKEYIDAAVSGPDVWAKLLSEELRQQRPDQYAQTGDSRPMDDLTTDFDDFMDQRRKRMRVITTFYRSVTVRRFLSAGGKTEEVTNADEATLARVRESFPNAQEWKQEDYQLNSVTFCWAGVLEEKKNLRPFDRDAKYSLIMAQGYMTRDEDGRRPYGLVKQHCDPQDEVNKRRSKMLHLLNTNQVWYEEGAFGEKGEGSAREEASRPDGWVKHRREFKIERVTHEELAQAQYELLKEAKVEIDQAGVNREIEGKSTANSGREFQLRLKEGLKSIRELVSNIRAARRRVAEYWMDEILDDAKRKAQAEGKPLEISRYDIVVEEAPETINLQGETFEHLVQLANGGMAGLLPPEVILEVAPLEPKVKQKILAGVAQQRAIQAELAAKGAPQQGQAGAAK